MINSVTEKRLAAVISWGTLAVTLLVTDRIGYDPVNVGKMVLLSIIAGGCAGLVLSTFKLPWKNDRVSFLSLSLFLGFILFSILLSSNPWEKGFFGNYGRNTGLLTYSALAVLFYSTTFFRSIKSFGRIIVALLLAGFLNLIYCNLSLLGFEIFKLNNPYNTILGTFGNPNFIGAFLGIFVTSLVGLLAYNQINTVTKVFISLIAVFALFTIKETQALQGFIVVAAGISLVAFFFIRSLTLSSWILKGYSVFICTIATFSALSTMQMGPFGDLLYKPSLSFRVEYWSAGLNMGVHNLLTGVGLDSYGTYFREYRRPSAIESPGVNVTTDAAHNVFIDIFAGTGVLGLIAYIAVIFLVLRASFKIFKTRRDYDPIFVILFTTWFTYQIQSLVSINQIGLAIWGWVLGGALIGYSKIASKFDPKENILKNYFSKSPKSKVNKEAPQLSAGQSMSFLVGLLVGTILAIPPFIAEVKVRNAFSSKSAESLIVAANSWPQDSNRMNNAIFRLAEAGLGDEAQSLVNNMIAKFPDEYSAWYSLYKITLDGSSQKQKYLEKLRQLDPYNPEFAKK